MIRTLQFLVLVFTALALVLAGARLVVLPNKVELPQAAYFTDQDNYCGWAAEIMNCAIFAGSDSRCTGHRKR